MSLELSVRLGSNFLHTLQLVTAVRLYAAERASPEPFHECYPHFPAAVYAMASQVLSGAREMAYSELNLLIWLFETTFERDPAKKDNLALLRRPLPCEPNEVRATLTALRDAAVSPPPEQFVPVNPVPGHAPPVEPQGTAIVEGSRAPVDGEVSPKRLRTTAAESSLVPLNPWVGVSAPLDAPSYSRSGTIRRAASAASSVGRGTTTEPGTSTSAEPGTSTSAEPGTSTGTKRKKLVRTRLSAPPQ